MNISLYAYNTEVWLIPQPQHVFETVRYSYVYKQYLDLMIVMMMHTYMFIIYHFT